MERENLEERIQRREKNASKKEKLTNICRNEICRMKEASMEGKYMEVTKNPVNFLFPNV